MFFLHIWWVFGWPSQLPFCHMKSREGDEVAAWGGWGRRNASGWPGGTDRLSPLLEGFRPRNWPDAEHVHTTHLGPDGRILAISAVPARDRLEDVLGDTVERWMTDERTRDEYRSALAHARATERPQRYEVSSAQASEPWTCIITPMLLRGRLVGFLIESRPVEHSSTQTGTHVIRPRALNV